MTDPVEVADGVTVEDVFVDWNLNASNTPTLTAILSASIPTSTWEPVGGDEGESEWIVESDYGLFQGYADGPQHPPADESPRTTTSTLQHADGHTVDRVPMYEHEVKNAQNRIEPDSAISVTYKLGPEGPPRSITTRVDLAQRLVDGYLNGPLGTDITPYWYWYRDQTHKWNRGPVSKDRYDDYLDATVVLVHDGIYTWRPKRLADVDEDDDVFEHPGDPDG